MPYTTVVVTRYISNRFKISDISKYDVNLSPQGHLSFFITTINDNDLIKEEVESVMVKKLKGMVLGGS